MQLSTVIADRFAARSSRRVLLTLAGGSALGAGLMLTQSGVALGATSAVCYGCPGGSDCASPAPPCANCYDSCSGGGCPSGCSQTGMWTVCQNCCKVRCRECCCSGSGCTCFQAVPYACCTNHRCPCAGAPEKSVA